MAEEIKAKKGAKKRFFEIKAPITAAKIHVLAQDESELPGKVVKIDLTKVLRGKNFELRLKIEKQGQEMVAEPASMQLLQSYVRKTIRNGIDYIEDSFETSCKNSIVRIKPFLITRKRVSRAVRNELRKTTRKYLESYLKMKTTRDLFAEITTNKLQKTLSQKLKKIYPLALCEIRGVIVIKQVELKEKLKEEVQQTAPEQ